MRLVQKLNGIREELAQAAQEVIDEWDQDEDIGDPELGFGGICDRVADALANVIAERIDNVEVDLGAPDGDDHQWVVVTDEDDEVVVDIHPSHYETGGGYNWRKIEDAEIRPEHIYIVRTGSPAVCPNPAPPTRKVTYLAVLPRHRRPKAVPASAVGWYQQNAHEFYEAPGMTAASAREAIADGTLKPTWIKGKPVVGYSAAGKPVAEERTSLGEMIRRFDAQNSPNGVLRIGSVIYTPHFSYRSGSRFTWHEVGPSGFTYSQDPLTLGQLQKHLRNHDTFEMAYLQESYNGMSMGGIAVLAKSGRNLSDINNPALVARLSDLQGTRYRAMKVIEGGIMRPVDLEW